MSCTGEGRVEGRHRRHHLAHREQKMNGYERHPHLHARALCCLYPLTGTTTYAQKSRGGHPWYDLAPQSASFGTVALRERQHLAMAGSGHVHSPLVLHAPRTLRGTVTSLSDSANHLVREQPGYVPTNTCPFTGRNQMPKFDPQNFTTETRWIVVRTVSADNREAVSRSCCRAILQLVLRQFCPPVGAFWTHLLLVVWSSFASASAGIFQLPWKPRI